LLEYKRIQYQVLQTANPTGFRWTVYLDENRTKIGTSYSRSKAIFKAARAIDKALSEAKDQDKQGCLIWRPPSFNGKHCCLSAPFRPRAMSHWSCKYTGERTCAAVVPDRLRCMLRLACAART
jgi:hypothetical protein